MGCAAARPVGDGASAELSAQIKAMASRQAELERKLDRLEARLEAQHPPAHAPSVVSVVAPRSEPEAPAVVVPRDLATVKLTPPSKRATPPVATVVPLREPDSQTVEQLMEQGTDAERPDALEADYKSAMEAISTGDVERGAQGLVSFAERHPRDERAPHALLQAGIGLQTSGDPQSAIFAFEKLADDYPMAKESPEAMVRMADCQLRLKRAERARAVYARVVSRYPGTAAARQAEAGLKGLAAAASTEAAQ